jgi:hypothetical protein
MARYSSYASYELWYKCTDDAGGFLHLTLSPHLISSVMHGSLKLTLAALLTLASSASASCYEAIRFGDSVTTPSKSGPLKYGDVRVPLARPPQPTDAHARCRR